ncbi:MAG: DnaB-like helicase C-terminal domain-containing protein [Clostridia bacterium]|nr:DnaB-like helicase C-terminal domain-containing protein [Clostridia bacterium]
MSNTRKKLDYDLFEYIIAFNCTVNDLYIATIIDSIKIEYINNLHIRNYLHIIFEFYKTHGTLPNATEIKAYLINDDLKESYKDVVKKFKTLDSEYNYDELIVNTEQFIKEKAVYYAVKDTVNKFADDTASKNTDEVFQLFENACNISLVDNMGFDYFNNIDTHINNLTIVDNFIPTGYSWLDKMLGGGWLEGGRALYMFMGATNVGKSIVLGNIAAKLLLQGKTVVLFTLEMPETLYSKRISSQLSRIPFALLKSEAEELRKYLYRFKQANPQSRLIIKEFPPSAITTNHLKAFLKKLKQKYKIEPDAVVLDYLTLMLALNPVGSLYSDNKMVAEQVRSLSYPQNFGCPFISAGQLNRTGLTETNPGLESTSESIGIPMTADAIFSLWQTEAEKELGILNMGIRKSRFGVNFGTQAFKIDYDTLAIDEMEEIFSNNESIQNTDDILRRISSVN